MTSILDYKADQLAELELAVHSFAHVLANPPFHDAQGGTPATVALGRWTIDFYRGHSLDPKSKLWLPSDGLDLDIWPLIRNFQQGQLQDIKSNFLVEWTVKDASGQTVSIPTEIEGLVDSVDITKSPPLLSIGGANYTLDKIKRVVRPGA